MEDQPLSEEDVLKKLKSLEEMHYRGIIKEYPIAAMALKSGIVKEEELRLIAYSLGLEDVIYAYCREKGIAFQPEVSSGLAVLLMAALREEDRMSLNARINNIKQKLHKMERQLERQD